MSHSTIPAGARAAIREEALRVYLNTARKNLIKAANSADEARLGSVHERCMASLADVDEAKAALGE